MKDILRKVKILRYWLVYSLVLLIFFISTNPEDIGFRGVLIAFFLIFGWLYMSFSLLLRALLKIDNQVVVAIWSVSTTVVVALSSIGQLSRLDVLVITLLTILSTLYLNKRRKH